MLKVKFRITMPLEIVEKRDIEKLEKLKDNLDWFYSNYKYFKNYYKNQYIAIKDKRFLDKDIELEKLITRLKIKDYNDSIVIEFVY